MPKVSICIPTYNRAELLECAIASALNQDFLDHEIIVCDDGSTDATPALMDKLTDPRIRYIRHSQNIGKSNNMISGFQAAQGEYFIKFDDDDRLTPGFLKETVAVLDTYPEIDFVSTDHWIIDPHNQRLLEATEANSDRWGRTNRPRGKVENLLKTVFVDQSLQIGATLFRRQVLAEVNYMRPDWQNCEDNDLLVRLSLVGKQAYYLPARLMEYRVHPGQQGLHRAVPYLRDKVRYLEAYSFPDPDLEQVRQRRLIETQLLLGLRLIEQGEIEAGCSLVRLGQAADPKKARLGLLLAAFPSQVRPALFHLIRQLKNAA